MIGARLGPYEITAKLGEGGMGTVWRATDTTLEREVAIKLLPDDFAGDPERHARFEREAKLLASLNHPNIAVLHALDHVEGKHALVMELVEGEGLEERIARGSVPLDEAIPIAQQIAEALEAAHEHGIVHRDLKPANVRIRPDGTVKVLDFGLAKTWDAGGESGLTHSPTITRAHTAAGVILGTAAYMSPEQARGKAVDKRADIWAFGALLWEMLTGRRLFAGETVTDVLANVLKQEADWILLPESTPVEIRRLLRRCLERNPRNRLHDIADARIALQDALAGEPPWGLPAEPAGASAERRSLARWRWAAAALALAALAGAIGALGPGRHPPPPAPRRLAIVLPSHQRLVTEGDAMMAFSPDGADLVIVGESDGHQVLLRRTLDGTTSEAIVGTDGATSPFYSPDGSWIGFVANSRLMKVPAGGGTPFGLADCQGAGGACWLPDDTLVYAPIYSDGLFLVPAEGGESTRLTTPDRDDGELGHWWPQLLPDGHHVLFTAFRTPVDTSRIGVLDLADRSIRWVVDGGFFGRWVTTGHLLYAKGDRLFAVPFDAKSVAVTGPAVAVIDDLRVSQTGGYAMFAVSKRGDLAYVTESAGNPASQLVWIDRAGHTEPAVPQRERFLSVALSPDGRRAAVTVQGASRDLWTYSFARGTLSRLTSSPDTEFNPTWSADGKELYYVVDRPPFSLYRTPAGMPDAGEPLFHDTVEVDTTGPAVSADGHWLAFERSNAGTRSDIFVQPVDGHDPARPYRASRADERSPTFSPDGRWLAYQSDETGRSEIYVDAFPGPGEHSQLTADGGVQPLWTRGSGEIFYRHDDEFRVVGTHRQGSHLVFGTPRTVATIPIVRGATVQAHTYDVTSDGTRIIAVTTPDAERPRRIQLITDWLGTLPRLAPRSAR